MTEEHATLLQGGRVVSADGEYDADVLIVGEKIAAVGEIDAPPEQAHHVLHVLRLAPGDALTIFDGEGREYPALIRRAAKSGVTLRVGDARLVDRESPLRVTLAQGISSGERMDYTIQKAVELGIHAVQPLSTERSVVRLNAERAAKRVAHWQAIAVAAKQARQVTTDPSRMATSRSYRSRTCHGRRYGSDTRPGACSAGPQPLEDQVGFRRGRDTERGGQRLPASLVRRHRLGAAAQAQV